MSKLSYYDTLNNQLIKMGAKEGDTVLCKNWLAKVIMNEFGFGLSMQTSHDPRPLCDGFFPAMEGLRLWNKPTPVPAPTNGAVLAKSDEKERDQSCCMGGDETDWGGI